jgi:uridine monophosphate synthetase
MEELILQLYAIGAIKFGSFEIKKDYLSPFQVDFRGVISHPKIAKELCHAFWEKAMHLSFDMIAGASNLANSVATYLAWEQEIPLVAKAEGRIEGSYKTGQKCLVLQDKGLGGAHTLDLIDSLEEEGIEVRDVLTFLDLGLGSKKKIKSRGYISHSILTMPDVLQILFDEGKLKGDHFKLASDFLENV